MDCTSAKSTPSHVELIVAIAGTACMIISSNAGQGTLELAQDNPKDWPDTMAKQVNASSLEGIKVGDESRSNDRD